ncbi:MAG: hypothetical protein CSA72_02135 [Rhodobacterales bacterium]|nr:MAG: hypothetical protein CSA72_02135 [Rhodobacterales bacterium]
MAECVAALDGGGSRTRLALADRAGRVTRCPEGSGCSPTDVVQWRSVLTDVLAPATGAAHLVAGMAGVAEDPSAKAAAHALLSEVIAAPVTLMGDADLARAAAFGGGHGVLIVAGTGSVAIAEGPHGAARAGGWGPLYSDQGSGYAIARAALRQASDGLEGVTGWEEEDFAQALCGALGIAADPQALYAWSAGKPRREIAALTGHVAELAEAGDPAAQALLASAGRELAKMAEAAALRAGLGLRFAWSGAGSVLGNPHVAQAVVGQIGPPAEPAFTPLPGALVLAARAASWDVSDQWCSDVARQLAG